MSKGMLMLLTCLLACSTIIAQFDVIDDEEFEAAVRESSASVPSVAQEAATTSPPLIVEEATSASSEPEPSFDGRVEVPAAEERTENVAPSEAVGSEISRDVFDDDEAPDGLDEGSLPDVDGASNAKVLTIVGSCIAALGALFLF